MPQNFAAVKSAASEHQIDLESCKSNGYAKALEDRKSQIDKAQQIRERVADAASYEREVRGLFQTVATSLSAVSPLDLEIVTEPLDELDLRQQLLCKAPRRFKAASSDLVLRGVIVLDPRTNSRVALGMFIQGSSALSPRETGLNQSLRVLFGEVWNRDCTFQKVSDGSGLKIFISTASPVDDDGGKDWQILKGLEQKLHLMLGRF